MTEFSPLFAKSFVSPETYDAFVSVVGRIEASLDEEMRQLKLGRHDGLSEMTRQKRQGFLELNRIMRSLDQSIPSQDIIARLAALRGKLAENSALLDTHLKAAKEVTNIIVRVMRDAESDGTYSSSYVVPGYDLE